jgi:CMP-N,N'-diacetyllegionaminic acid synthase
MLQGNKVLAVIPARGESRKVSGKHLRKVAGRTLLGWTILAAQKSHYIDQVILSSDDLLIIQEAKNYGCDVPFLRPKHLARIDSPLMPAIFHALEMTQGYDIIVVLQPSSPLRTAEDIDNAIEVCVQNKASACVTVTEPTYGGCNGYTLAANNQLVPTVPGQFSTHSHHGEACYVPNAAVAVADIAWLQREKTFLTSHTVGVVMPRERSIDVDSEFDIWQVNSYKEYLAQRAATQSLEPA